MNWPDRFDSVFISIGTWRESWVYQPAHELKASSRAALPGSGGEGERVPSGKIVAIIGGETPPSIRRARHCAAARKLPVFYRREHRDMLPSRRNTGAKDEGAQFVFLAAPHRAIGDRPGIEMPLRS